MNERIPIQLDEHFSRFVDEEVRQGHFGSVTEVVEAALRLLEEDRQKVEALRLALIEGEESGFPTNDFDFNEFLAEMHKSQ